MGNFLELLNSSKPVLVDFFAQWCGPCKTMGPILEEVAGKLQHRAKIVKVDVDKNPQVAKTYAVQGVPTLILFKEGRVLWRKSGVVQPSELLRIIEQFL